jgi:chloramphenicol-sensitive protein RarD
LNNFKYYLAAISAFAIWGSFSLVLKPLHAYASLDILFYRVFSCAVILSVISVLFKKESIKTNLAVYKSLPASNRRLVLFLNIGASVLLTFNWLSFIYVMNHVSVRATSVAYLVCPILTTLLAYFLLREKLTRLQWLSVLLSCIGCLLLSYDSLSGMVFSAFIGLTYACYLIIQSKNKAFDKFLILNFHILISALILLPLYPSLSGPVPTAFKFYLYVEIIAVFFTMVPLFLNLYALTGISSSTVGMILNVNPIIAFALSGLLYHEKLGAVEIVAYSIIFVAVIIFNIHQNSKPVAK